MRFCGQCGSARIVATASDADLLTAPTAPAPTQASGDVTDALRSFVTPQVADRIAEVGAQLTEERRLVTALFADISGFTPLASRLDPEELMEVIDPVVSMLSSIVGRYDGFVEKFAGDALLALFGAPVAHEDDAARALRVALEMHRELARLRTELSNAENLTLHVGINSGHGIARIIGSEVRADYGVLGDAVVLAQRLESVTPSGETYVSESTHELTRDAFEFEVVGDLTLKGKSEAVTGWRLLGEKRVRATAPGQDQRLLLGRETELAVVAQAIAGLSDGRGSVVGVTGEPGIGKSRLTEEIRRQAEHAGVTWLETRCVSYGAALPYWPFAELVRLAVGIEPDDPPPEASAMLAATIADEAHVGFFARLLGLPAPAVGIDAGDLEPEAFRRGLHGALVEWLRSLAAAAGPLVVSIEDAHWADASSIALARDLADALQADSILIYVTGRPEAQQLLADIGGDRLVSVALEPLTEPAVEALIEGCLDGSPPATLTRLVLERTGGNPFFAEELVRALRDQGVLELRNGRWRLRAIRELEEVPPTVEGVLAARIDALPRRAANVLQTASVIGRRLRLPLLERVIGEPNLTDLVDQLIGRGFLDRSDNQELVFHHALVQEVAYSRILRKHRRDVHHRTAEAAEALYGAGDDAIDLLARHLYLGEAGPKAVEYLLRAGRRSRALYANEEALLHLSRAAEVTRALGESNGMLTEILLDLADVHDLVGDYDEALELYGEVRRLTGDIRAWRGLASAHRRRGEYEAALAVVDEGIASEELRGQDVAPLWLESGWSLSQLGRLDQARDVLRGALEATAPRADTIVGQLLLELACTEALEGRFGEALEHGRLALEIFEHEKTVRGLATALRVVGGIYKDLDRLDEAAASLRRGLEMAERVGAVEEIGGCLINLGMVEEDRGAIAEGIACDRRAIEEFERIGHGAGRARGYANLAHKLALAGDYDEALRWCDRTIEFSHSIGLSVTVADAIDTIAVVTFRQGRFPEAAARAEDAAALYLEMGSAPYAAESLALATRAWREAGDTKRARATDAQARRVLKGHSALVEVPSRADATGEVGADRR
jgi:class 3 adenylate cyclase/tetratricopeptide (TPR) repeat protein